MNKCRKLTTEMFLVMAVSAVLAVSCVLFLYTYRFGFYAWAVEHGFGMDGREEYKEWFLEQAKQYELKPDSAEAGKDKYDEDNLPSLSEYENPYIWVSIYRKDTGTYVTGHFPELLASPFWGSWLWSDADIFVGTEPPMIFDAEFADCTAEVHIQSYRIMKIIPVYLLFGILLSVAIFLVPVLVFVHRRMAYLGQVRAEMRIMAEGDLDHPLTVRGKDEISFLAGELNELRMALKENIEKEKQSHLAKQELIRAVSHDLRTPLTTLYGYLEVLDHGKGDAEKYPEYVRRCIRKTEEIRGMSDKMFEYALVFDSAEEVDKRPLQPELFYEEIYREAEDLKIHGFQIEWKEKTTGKSGSASVLMGNSFLLKRLTGNLFSNILRYGDPDRPVEAERKTGTDRLEILLKNRVKKGPRTSGSGVGLQSAEKIARLHGGELQWQEKEDTFEVCFWLPLDLRDRK